MEIGPTLHDLRTQQNIILSATHQNKGKGGKDKLRDREKMQEMSRVQRNSETQRTERETYHLPRETSATRRSRVLAR